MPKGVPIGPFVTVEIPVAKRKDKKVFVSVRASTAKTFGIPVSSGVTTTKKGVQLLVTGSRGAGSIKVKVKVGDKFQFRRIPVPSGATLVDIQAWIATWGKQPNGATFVSRNGRSKPVAAKASGGGN